MREQKTYTFDGFNYVITQLGAKTGRKVLARVMRMVAGAAGAAGAMVGEGEGGTEAALAALAKLVEGLSDADVDFLCDTFAATTMFGPEGSDKLIELAGAFDVHFAGKYGSMVRWLWFALEANFGSFLGGLGLNTEALMAQAKAAMSGTPKAANPTAPSGASSSQASAG